MNEGIIAVFDQKLAEYKQMVILRQEECTQIAEVLDKKGGQLSSKAEKFKTTLIVLGVVVAAKAALELTMLSLQVPPVVMNIISILFLLIGASVSVLAALEKANRYEEKAGGVKMLSSQCRSYDRRFMSDYKKSIDPRDPAITLARLESLLDLQNESLDNIRQRSDNLGVDLSLVKVSYRIDGGV